MRRTILAALAALTLAPVLAGPAGAQYYGNDDDRPRRRDYGRDFNRDYYDGGGRYRDDYGYGGPRRGGRGFGSLCVTARGNCPTRPGPFNTPCGCDIPGFGIKRGAIGG